jgi:hypothetical protein
MNFRMQKELSFHFTLDEKELVTFYTLLQKMRNIEGHEDVGYKVSEFEITEEERQLVFDLDSFILNSDAYEELKLAELDEEE